jgi:hypothetical protein
MNDTFFNYSPFVELSDIFYVAAIVVNLSFRPPFTQPLPSKSFSHIMYSYLEGLEFPWCKRHLKNLGLFRL